MSDNLQSSFVWTEFYSHFADKLLTYENNRSELLKIIKNTFYKLNMKYPFMDNGEPLDDICPFTVFGIFNKGITTQNRIALMKTIGEQIGVSSTVPTEFDGVPVLNNMKAWFFGYKSDRNPDDISNLWEMFKSGMRYADTPTKETENDFVKCYDTVTKQHGVKWNLTMGLYWIRPNSYLNLDEKNRNYLLMNFGTKVSSVSDLKNLPDAKKYIQLINICKESFFQASSTIHSFPQLSYNAWTSSNSVEESKPKLSKANFIKWFVPLINALRKLGGSATPEQARNQIISYLNLTDDIVNETRGKNGLKKFDNEVAWARNYLAYEGFIDKSVRGVWTLTEKGQKAHIDDQLASEIFFKWVEILKERRENNLDSGNESNEKRYWLYSPGDKSVKWDEFYKEGIMAIEWDELGDLKKYPNKDAMKAEMKKLYGKELSYRNSAHATWQFANEIRPGDIVYAKKGLYKVIGRGIVESEYMYDEKRSEYKSIRKVTWTNNGEWEHPGQAAMKTLTDITAYTDYLQKLESLFIDEATGNFPEDQEIEYEQYSMEDFLDEVFMDSSQYETLTNLLKNKKNIILQGAPGVGKTFAAKRLAYSIMGSKDTSRVMMVQFHQSYSYEDFIMGFRPTKTGFELVPGPFYQFCKTAQEDDENDYFFIIDEINRGNLSKILGELLMLIEKDKRSEKLRLLYSNELFSVPKNVHIIGMMNTADRSLALIDYALRRRFAFFEIEPAFDSDGFKTMTTIADNPKFDLLVDHIKELNAFISNDESLGSGFRIGHSYLCTNTPIEDEWIASVIKYEFLPLINEYWFDEPAKVEQWTNKLCGVMND